MNEREILQGLMKKQKKGEGKTDNKNAVAALLSLCKTEDERKLAGYLSGLHFSVCQNFFLEFCQDASDKEIAVLANALMEDENMMSKNPTLFLYPKGFAAVYALTEKQKFTPALMIMNRILAKAETKKGFAAGVFTVFGKIFTTHKDSAGLMELHNQLKNGDLRSEKAEMERLARFLNFAQVNHEKTKTKEILSDLPKEDASIRFAEQVNEIGYKMLGNIEKTQVDIVEMLKKLTADSDASKAQESENAKLRKKVDDLTERLRVSLQMSDVSKNQELVNLKSEISKAIKLDYADYERSKDKGHSKDLVKVYKAMLARIFKQLKRLDIPLV